MVEELAIAWLPHDWQALKNATVSLCWVNLTKCIWTAFRKRYFSRCWLDDHPRLCLSALRSVLNLLCKTRPTPEVTFSCFSPLTPDYFWGHGSLWNHSVQHLPFSFLIFSLIFFLLTTIRCCPFSRLSLNLSLDEAWHLICGNKRPLFLVGPWERIRCWKLSPSIWFNLWKPKAQRRRTFWVTRPGCWYAGSDV